MRDCRSFKGWVFRAPLLLKACYTVKMRLPDNDIKVAVLTHFPDAKFIYRFGSYGTEYQSAESDLDLAVYPEGELSEVNRIEAQLSLGADLNIDVDLVNLSDCSTVIAAQVVNTGECLYTANAEFSDLYAVRAITMALDLQYKLKGYFEDMEKRGSVF